MPWRKKLVLISTNTKLGLLSILIGKKQNYTKFWQSQSLISDYDYCLLAAIL